jgi:Fur family peroxide stress response transcriptional regulator
MNIVEQMGSMVEAFRASGHRWTPQRQAVVETLLRLRHHPTADEIYAAVRRQYPGMSRATVYNTMEALAAMGRIATVTSPDGTRRYDPNPTPHHHLRCRVCGSIVDMAADPNLPAAQIPARRPRGFRIELVQIEYHGVCSACDRENPERVSGQEGGGGARGTRRSQRRS